MECLSPIIVASLRRFSLEFSATIILNGASPDEGRVPVASSLFRVAFLPHRIFQNIENREPPALRNPAGHLSRVLRYPLIAAGSIFPAGMRADPATGPSVDFRARSKERDLGSRREGVRRFDSCSTHPDVKFDASVSENYFAGIVGPVPPQSYYDY